MKLKLNAILEVMFLALVLGMVLYAALGPLWQQKIKHDFPTGYFASDTFIHLTFAEEIKERGHYRYYPSYMAWGFDDVIGHYPPIIHHLAALFSLTSSLQTYDTILLMLAVLIALSIGTLYFILKKYNKNIALMSLPLSLLVFTGKATIGFNWGQWGYLTGAAFLIGVFWAVTQLDVKHSYILLGLFIGIDALAHTSEAMMGVLFTLLYIGIKLIIRKGTKENIFDVVKAGIIAAVISGYYLIIFYFTWFAAEFEIKVTKTLVSFGVQDTAVRMDIFGFFLPLVIIGMVVAALFIIRKKINVASLMGFFMLLMGYSYLLGAGRRATQARIFWPLYLAVFLGITLYFGLRIIIRKWSIIYSYAIGIILLMVIFTQFYTPNHSPGLMNNEHWQYFQWARENLPENSEVFYFYSDTWMQNAMLYLDQRNSFITSQSFLGESLQNRTIPREFRGKMVTEGGARLPYRKGLFSYGYHSEEVDKSPFVGSFDICKYDFYAFDKFSAVPVLAQYNLLIRQQLLQNSYMEEVYANNLVTVLKNNNPSEDCLPREGVVFV
ncbi:hypothetical protein GOV09_02205 [Candidatus Woesearchaeota archaeon]|nr:hypothetical protein [Candidatus Woesearchaeota archaeon]